MSRSLFSLKACRGHIFGKLVIYIAEKANKNDKFVENVTTASFLSPINIVQWISKIPKKMKEVTVSEVLGGVRFYTSDVQ